MTGTKYVWDKKNETWVPEEDVRTGIPILPLPPSDYGADFATMTSVLHVMKFIVLGSGEVDIDYTNYRGERGVRTIIPYAVNYCANEWHPERQWLVYAIDKDRGVRRVFALKDIHSWKEKEAGPREETPPRDGSEHL